MCARWKRGKNFDVEHLLEKLEKLRIKDGTDGAALKASRSDSSVAFEGGSIYKFATDILYYAVDFHDDVPETIKSKLAIKALYATAEQGVLTSDSFMNALQDAEVEYLKRPVVRYTLLTTLSLQYGDYLNRVSWNDCTATFHDDHPKEIKRTSVWNLVKHKYFGEIPDDYSQARIFVSARSPIEVADSALDFVDFIRGIWNMYYVGGRNRLLSSHWQPLSKIALGPLHVLKEKPDTYWYSPDYVKPLEAVKLSDDWDQLKAFEYKIRRAIRKSNYPDELEQAFIRYAQALDLRDKETAVLKLWGLLEMLTGTQKEKGPETVKRISFIFKDVNFARQLGHHLRIYRNAHLHQGEEHSDAEGLVTQAKLLVEHLIWFHLDHGNEYSSMAEAGEVLSMTPKLSHLRSRIDSYNRQIEMCRKAIRIREGR